jgi:hypothetical protein
MPWAGIEIISASHPTKRRPLRLWLRLRFREKRPPLQAYLAVTALTSIRATFVLTLTLRRPQMNLNQMSLTSFPRPERLYIEKRFNAPSAAALKCSEMALPIAVLM